MNPIEKAEDSDSFRETGFELFLNGEEISFGVISLRGNARGYARETAILGKLNFIANSQ